MYNVNMAWTDPHRDRAKPLPFLSLVSRAGHITVTQPTRRANFDVDLFLHFSTVIILMLIQR